MTPVRAVRGLHIRAKVVEQGLYLPPVDVGGEWILEKGSQQICLLVAHDAFICPYEHEDRLPPNQRGGASSSSSQCTTGTLLPRCK